MTVAEQVGQPGGTPFAVRLEQWVGAGPDRPAVTCDARTLTRTQLDRHSTALARAYAARGVGTGDLVTIMLPNGVEFLAAALAVWKLGATPQPVSARLPAHELRQVLAVADPALVVGSVGVEVGGRASVPAGFEPDPADGEPLPVRVSPVWKAPTSGGSSGTPKLILAGQPAVAELMDIYAGLFGMVPGGVHLVAGPLHHNGPFLMAVAALFTGNHVVVMPRFDAAETLRLVERHRVDWLMLVPTMMHRISRLPAADRTAADLSSLRVVLHAAAPCPAWLKREWIAWLGAERIVELYATTEAQAACVITGADWLAHPGSVGRVVSGEMRILDADGRELPPGEVGEVWVRPTPGTAPTYRYRGARAESRDGGWETHGDCGWFDEHGYLHLADRRADMILVGGANVYPAEVEAALDEHPAVRSSCVIGLPDEDLGAVVHAIVQAEPTLDVDELHDWLAQRLAPGKRPRSIERVDAPLRDDAGKVRRSALRAERVAS